MEFRIRALLDKIADANKCIDQLEKLKKLHNNPLKDDMDWLIKKVELIKQEYAKEYDYLTKYLEEEADFITGAYQYVRIS